MTKEKQVKDRVIHIPMSSQDILDLKQTMVNYQVKEGEIITFCEFLRRCIQNGKDNL